MQRNRDVLQVRGALAKQGERQGEENRVPARVPPGEHLDQHMLPGEKLLQLQ